MIKFSFFTGDLHFLEYGGKWLSNVQTSEQGEEFYLGIELLNWEDSQGELGPGETKYHISLAVICLSATSSLDTVASALKSCWGDDGTSREPSELEIIGALWDYGASIPVDQINTNNWRQGMRLMRKVAREVTLEYALGKSINRIGQTGAEHLAGDLLSSLQRGLEAEDKNAWLMARIYGAKAEELEKMGYKNPLRSIKEK